MISPAAFVPNGKPSAKSGITSSAGFNSKADLIICGNAITNVQTSSYIRAKNQTSCNGFEFQPGVLQYKDMNSLFQNKAMFNDVYRYLDSPYFKDHDAIAYVFFHFAGIVRRFHGVLITTTDHKLLRRFDGYQLGLRYSEKSVNVLDFCQKFVTFEDENRPARPKGKLAKKVLVGHPCV